MSEIRKQVETLFAVIAGANAELERLRGSCPHPSYLVGYYDFAGDRSRMRLQRICNDCFAPIGAPSFEEDANFRLEQATRFA